MEPKLAGTASKTKIEIAGLDWGWIVFYAVAFLCVLGAFYCDASVNQWLVEHVSKRLRSVMGWVSKMGDWPAHVALGLLLLALAWQRGSKKWQRIFLAMLLACALAGISARIIKVAVGRPRPSAKREITTSTSRFHAKYQSFPSGHTASSTAFFGTLFLYRRRIGA
ncbi:MAG: phosphatase PAP2 family protein, partial [Verrucomicrobiota bacterium]